MIEGVVLKALVTHADERGFFREVIRVTDDFFKEGFGQLSHAVVYTGVAKAWHIHERQIDWWYVLSGVLKVGLHDTRAGSPTYRETMELSDGDSQQAASCASRRGRPRLQGHQRPRAHAVRHVHGVRRVGRGPDPPRRPVDRLRLGEGSSDQVTSGTLRP